MTDAPVDLDDMALKLSTFKLPLNWETAMRLVAELRAARAVSQEASEVRAELAAEVVRHEGQERKLAEGWAKLRETKRAIRAEAWERGSREGLDAVNPYGGSAPPADEVAGLLEDVLAIRRHVGGGHGGERRVDMSHRLDRIENHLKGKR